VGLTASEVIDAAREMLNHNQPPIDAAQRR
jgi:hypothetical protein